jgi:hypothetical protein
MVSAFLQLSNIARFLMTQPAASFTDSPVVLQGLSLVVFMTHCWVLLPTPSSRRSGSSSSAVAAVDAAVAAMMQRWQEIISAQQKADAAIQWGQADLCLNSTGISTRCGLGSMLATQLYCNGCTQRSARRSPCVLCALYAAQRPADAAPEPATPAAAADQQQQQQHSRLGLRCWHSCRRCCCWRKCTCVA